jgi:hypothetical protein
MRTPVNSFGLVIVLLAAMRLASQNPASRCGSEPCQIMSVRTEVQRGISPVVRDLPTRVSARSALHESEPLLRVPLPPGLKHPDEADPVLQKPFGARPFSGPKLPTSATLSFEGLGQGQYGFIALTVPPDTNGAVGTSQYVQWANTSFAVFNKSTGALVAGPVIGGALFKNFGGPCAKGIGDGVVLYDKFADRWIISQMAARAAPYLECIAVSTSYDASGTYYLYSFQFPHINDYPKIGIWPDAYYITYNLFDSSLHFINPEVCAYDRVAMSLGQSAKQICFQPPTLFGISTVFALLPSSADGTTPPPVGAPNYLVSFGTNSLKLYEFHVDFSNSANSTFTGPTFINVAGFTPLCSGGTCVPQPGSSQQLDSVADRLMYRLAYRNFGDHESLVVNHTVSVGSSGGIRWYEIQNPGSSSPVVAQQGTFAPDSTYRWMGSIAMDQAGDILLGYSKSDGNSVFPSIALTGRVASDTANTMEPEINLVSGTGSQNSNRWGDYSALQVDPVDDCTFWYTQEYLKAGSPRWNTKIASFRFANCGVLITGLAPSSGPNAGGTTVQISGQGLSSSTAQTTVTFGQIPAAVNGCNPTLCSVTSPQYLVNQGTTPQTVNVQVMVNGETSDPNPVSNFTYLPGPACSAFLTCQDIPYGFPELKLSCSTPSNFYEGTLSQTPVATNTTTFQDEANDILGWKVVACTGQQPTLTGGFSGGSCSYFPAYTSPTYCGSAPAQPPNFCADCRKTGGICTTGSGGRKFCVHE